jgi:hypothetical protein
VASQIWLCLEALQGLALVYYVSMYVHCTYILCIHVIYHFYMYVSI